MTNTQIKIHRRIDPPGLDVEEVAYLAGGLTLMGFAILARASDVEFASFAAALSIFLFLRRCWQAMDDFTPHLAPAGKAALQQARTLRPQAAGPRTGSDDPLDWPWTCAIRGASALRSEDAAKLKLALKRHKEQQQSFAGGGGGGCGGCGG